MNNLAIKTPPPPQASRSHPPHHVPLGVKSEIHSQFIYLQLGWKQFKTDNRRTQIYRFWTFFFFLKFHSRTQPGKIYGLRISGWKTCLKNPPFTLEHLFMFYHFTDVPQHSAPLHSSPSFGLKSSSAQHRQIILLWLKQNSLNALKKLDNKRSKLRINPVQVFLTVGM